MYAKKLNNDELWTMVNNGETLIRFSSLYGEDPLRYEEYTTKDFHVVVDIAYCDGYNKEICRIKGRSLKAKEIIKSIKLDNLYSLGYDVRTANLAMHTSYAFESEVAQTVNDVLNGNTIFCPFKSRNIWHNISNKSFELWYKVTTSRAAAPELSGPRWYAVLELVKDIIGPVEVDEGTFRRWSIK